MCGALQALSKCVEVPLGMWLLFFFIERERVVEAEDLWHVVTRSLVWDKLEFSACIPVGGSLSAAMLGKGKRYEEVINVCGWAFFFYWKVRRSSRRAKSASRGGCGFFKPAFPCLPQICSYANVVAA